MYCTQCGHEAASDDLWCSKCGERLGNGESQGSGDAAESGNSDRENVAWGTIVGAVVIIGFLGGIAWLLWSAITTERGESPTLIATADTSDDFPEQLISERDGFAVNEIADESAQPAPQSTIEAFEFRREGIVPQRFRGHWRTNEVYCDLSTNTDRYPMTILATQIETYEFVEDVLAVDLVEENVAEFTSVAANTYDDPALPESRTFVLRLSADGNTLTSVETGYSWIKCSNAR